MTGLAELRDRLRARLETISGLRAHDTWPGSITPPAAIVKPASGDYGLSFGGGTTHHFEVIVAARLSSLRAAQDQLDGYVSETGASSVKAALEGDPRTVHATVQRYRDYGDLEIGGVLYGGVVFDVDVVDLE